MEEFNLHWAYNIAKKTIEEHGEIELYTCASGITPSGTIHIGNIREIITVDIVKRAFKYMGKNVRHIHSWDENDVFRKVPKNMPNQEMLKENLRKCIVDVPDPYENLESYAQKHKMDVEDSVKKIGINPIFISQSNMYRNCKYANQIKDAIENKEKIKSILNEHRKEPLEEKWLPVSVFCSSCLKDTITKLEYTNDFTLYYECECNHNEEFDIRKKGYAKLLWRVDWPMRWAYEKVNFEPGGKDHSTIGGSFDTGKEIVKIWNHNAPTYLMYDFIKIKGSGGKISSSSGEVITLKDCLDIYEPNVIRFLFAGTRPNTEFAISFDTDVIKIYEDYDKCERVYYGLEEVDEKEKTKQKYIYEFSQADEDLNKISKEMPLQINIRHITTVLQINNLDVDVTLNFFIENNKEVNKIINKEKLRKRIECTKNWLLKYADEQFKFSIKEKLDEEFYSKLNDKEKEALKLLYDAVKNNDNEETLSQAIFEIPKKTGMDMKTFFTLCYKAIIGKDRGPKLANFIISIGKEKVLNILK